MQPETTRWQRPEGFLPKAPPAFAWRPFTAGLVAGVANVLVGHPLDTLKVRLQVAGRSGHRVVLSSLYSGAIGPLLTSPWLAAANFGVWDHLRTKLTLGWPQLFSRSRDASAAGQPGRCPESSSNNSAIFLAGVASGWLLCNLTCPVHNLKVQRQTQSMATSAGMWCMAQRAGLRGLFRGYVAHAMTESVGRGLYMLGFVSSKRALGLGSAEPGAQSLSELSSLFQRVLCGCAGGGLAWVMVYPCDVLRNRLMWDWQRKRYKGILDCLQHLLLNEGLPGLYRGISYSLARALPVAAVTLPTYDYVLRYLEA
eukprot:TRINITY_DN92414_c0_g1_i1.p1 TRINITY_DN92414_c0_g1~~TRINITY_DN92414_c0_g1_i1.p1  ORF type:complete len:336 (-),score=47.25 TRINITY_DN92414_c0_g1_i1:64-996(-)